MRRNLIAVTMGLVLGATMAAPGVVRGEPLKVDSVHSFLVFQVKHLDVSWAWGRVNNPTGTVNIDDANLGASSIVIAAKAENIDTGAPQRDNHLKNPDFFDAKQYPDLSFKSTSIKKAGENTYEVAGDLSLHGQTKPLTVTLTRVGAGEKGGRFGYRAGYETSFTIKRSDFGMTGMIGPVGDEVKLHVAIEVSR
jgi:polyisoprenoid-binding protein YceI